MNWRGDENVIGFYCMPSRFPGRMYIEMLPALFRGSTLPSKARVPAPEKHAKSAAAAAPTRRKKRGTQGNKEK
eukprot:6214581-Pleurochrysis_carterae.AAC.2